MSMPNNGNSFNNFNAGEATKTGKGFFGALLDVNFDNFVSVKFAKFIYILALLFSLVTVFMLWIVPFMAFLFDGRAGLAFVTLLLGWIPVGLFALFQLIGIRLFLEFVVATVKTSENTSKLVSAAGH